MRKKNRCGDALCSRVYMSYGRENDRRSTIVECGQSPRYIFTWLTERRGLSQEYGFPVSTSFVPLAVLFVWLVAVYSAQVVFPWMGASCDVVPARGVAPISIRDPHTATTRRVTSNNRGLISSPVRVGKLLRSINSNRIKGMYAAADPRFLYRP